MPRKREDVDAIFLSANSADARQINPQLRYFQASNSPVYATPAVYSGQINTSLDFDLNDITFCDIPWLLTGSLSGALSQEGLREIWQSFPDSYLRLVAMGIDAYNLVANIKTLTISSFSGVTGNLSLVSDNRIKRSLSCAKFTAGMPKVIDSISDYSETPPSQPADNTEIAPINQENAQ